MSFVRQYLTGSVFIRVKDEPKTLELSKPFTEFTLALGLIRYTNQHVLLHNLEQFFRFLK